MQVTRLEVFGFKSFMDRLVLPLEAGISGIVGPNGCGKSNIVDAFRWVLGETRARNLRGGTLEDVIFNGTDKLRPLGLAEVTITLRSAEKDLFADLISPALEAELLAAEALETDTAAEAGEASPPLMALENSAESNAAENAAENAAAAQLENVPESHPELPETPQVETTLVDSAVINLAGVASVDRGKPHLTVINGNLGTIETGVAEAAEPTTASGLKGVSPAALRYKFSWLKAVTEVQVTRRLYRSGESEFFINRVPCRLKDLKEFFRAIGLGARAYTIVAQDQVARIVTAKPDERRLILEEAAGVQGFRDKIAAAQRRLEETATNLARLDDIIKEVAKQVNSLRRLAARARNRQRIKEEIRHLDMAIYGDQNLIAERELGGIRSALESQRQAESRLEAQFQREQAQEREQRGALLALDVRGDELRARIDNAKEELRNRAQQRSSKLNRLNEISASGAAQRAERERQMERQTLLLARQGESEQRLETLSRDEESLLTDLRQAEAAFSQELGAVAEQLRELRRQQREQEEQFAACRDRLVELRTSLGALEEQFATLGPLEQLQRSCAGQLPAAADGAQVLAAGLGVPPEYARAAQAVLAERAAFLVCPDPLALANEIESGYDEAERPPLGLLRDGPGALAVPDEERPFPLLLDLITVADWCRRPVQSLLGDVYLCGSLAVAAEFFNSPAGRETALTLVTSAGQVVTRDSYHYLHQEAGIIQVQERITAVQGELVSCEETYRQLSREKADLQESVQAVESRQQELLRSDTELQGQVRSLEGARGAIRGRIEVERQAQRQAREDLGRLENHLSEGAESLRELELEAVQVREEIDALRPEIEIELQQSLTEWQGAYGALDEERQQRRTTLAQIAEALAETRAALDTQRVELSQSALAEQKLILQQEHIRERVAADYGVEAWQELLKREEPLAAEERQEHQETVRRLRERVAREGDVDPESIDRLAEEQERLDGLQQQHQDLAEAAVVLRRTIERLSVTSRERFLATFKAVNEQFGALIPRLFGGGRGHLELSDPDNPLTSGLEIVVRPPGKKLKSIELLSGGEKALCATALMMALFKERPSPLCILDEVDAPLDDANLERFIALVKDMSLHTQFIIITHNKYSMAAADTLIGVTMPEPGASKMISVSLQEAETHAA